MPTASNMKPSFILFALAGICALFWFVCLGELNSVEAKVRDLVARVEKHNDPLSGENVVGYGKAFFDGLTFGIFSGGNMLAETDKHSAKTDALQREAAELEARYSTAVFRRNCALGGCVVFAILGVVTMPRKKAD